jgi:hypothetical protein
MEVVQQAIADLTAVVAAQQQVQQQQNKRYSRNKKSKSSVDKRFRSLYKPSNRTKMQWPVTRSQRSEEP